MLYRRARAAVLQLSLLFAAITGVLIPPAADGVVQTSTVRMGSDGWDMATSGGLAFVASNFSGLTLLDVSDPLAPVRLGSTSTSMRVNAVAWEGDLLFAGGAGPDESRELQIFDVSSPESPVLLGVEALPGIPRSIDVVGDLVFTTGFRLPLCVVDVSDAAEPSTLACVTEPEFYDADEIVVMDGLALVAGGLGLTIYDVSDPSAPDLVSNTGRGARGLAVSDGLVFVQDIDLLVNVLDISAPEAPVSLASLSSRGVGVNGDIVVSDGLAVASLSRGFVAIDVSDPTRPIPQAEWGWREVVRRIDIVGGALYAAGPRDPTGGAVRVYDISNTRFPRTRSVLPSQTPEHTRVRDDIAYVADAAGLRRFDVSEPSRPQALGLVPFAGLFDFTLSKDALFATVNQVRRAGGLALFDISGATPAVAGSLDTFDRRESGRPRDIARRGDKLYVAHGRTGLRVFDVSDPGDPDELSDPDDPVATGARGIGIENDFAVVTKRSAGGIDIVDLDDPRDPVVVGHLDGRLISNEVIVRDGIAYVGLARELVVLGVWDPTAPVELSRMSQFTNTSDTDLDLEGSILHVSWAEGTWVVDVRDPEHPQRVLAVPTIGAQVLNGIAGDGRLAYAAGTSGVRIIDHGPEFVDNPMHLSGCPAVPNEACTPADEARLLLRRRDGKLRFRWDSPSLGTGDAIVADDDVGFGMCLYDASDAGPTLVWRAAMPPGDRWSDGEDELALSSPERGPHGVRSLRLDAASIRVRGRASVPYPLGANGPVRMQVMAETGACWDASFDVDSFAPEDDRIRARFPAVLPPVAATETFDTPGTED